MSEGTQHNHNRRKRVLWSVAAGLAIVVFAALAGFFFMESKTLKNNPDVAREKQSERIIDKVARLYQLPGGEQPTVAQVQDKEKLKDQTFFSAAQDGDYLLIYTNARLALLYREQDNKLVNVGPVTLDKQNDGTSQVTDVAGDSTEEPTNNQ